MLENCQNAKERWGGVNTLIDRWLHERQDLLVQYCAVSAMGKTSGNTALREEKLRELCQILVDYVSAGHFEIYDQLIKEGREFDDEEALHEAGRLFTIVDGTTEKLLDFNDKYLETDDLTSIDADLSSLGQIMEVRFTAEDRMISVLHTSHKDLVNG